MKNLTIIAAALIMSVSTVTYAKLTPEQKAKFQAGAKVCKAEAAYKAIEPSNKKAKKKFVKNCVKNLKSNS